MPHLLNFRADEGLSVMWGLFSLVIIDKELTKIEGRLGEAVHQDRNILGVREEFHKLVRAFSDPWTGKTWPDTPMEARDQLVSDLQARMRN